MLTRQYKIEVSKKEGKRAEAVLCRWTLASTLLFTHLQFMSSHYRLPPPCCLTPSIFLRERESKEKKRGHKSLWVNADLLFDLHIKVIIKQAVFD